MSQETKILIGVIFVSVAALVGGSIYFTKNAPATASDIVEVSKTLGDDSQKIGSPSASVKISEYGDFQCPACATAAPTVRQMLKDYGDKVYFEFHHFPLSIHRWADKAAEAAEAAGAQGKFFEYHDVLYSKQAEWSEASDAVPLFKKYALEMNLNTQKFNDELDKSIYREKVLAGLKKGNDLSVKATPTFFINGKRFEGGLRLDEWKTEIDSILKKTP